MSINAGFSFFQNIPATNNNPSSDQPNMLTNNNSTYSILGTDHVTFGISNGGIHKVIRFQDQSSSTPGAIVGFGQLYTNTLSGDQQLFYESGGGVVTQLTGPNAASATTNGYTWLPGGLLFQWGGSQTFPTGQSHINSSTLFTAVGNISFPNNCFNVVAVLSSNKGSDTTASNTLAITSFTKTQINWVYNSSASSGSSIYNGFYFYAIGN